MRHPKYYRVLFLLLLAAIGLMLIACSGGAASDEPPTLTVITGDVQSGSSGSLKAVTEDQKLSAKAAITTAADSRALLTYPDGSTVEIEPETELALAEGSSSLQLSRGMVWVAATNMTISVDAAGAVASATGGAGFSFEKADDGVTVKAVGGTVKFKAGSKEVELANGQLSSASSGEPSAPAEIEVENALYLAVTGEALVYIADPAGRGIGFHPTKEMVTRQIPDAWYSGYKARPQVISIPNPMPGQYTILLVAAGNQSQWQMDVSAAGADLTYAEPIHKSSMITWGTPTGLTMQLRTPGGNLTPSIGNIWTLYEAPPGKVGLADVLKRKDVKTGQAPPWAKQG